MLHASFSINIFHFVYMIQSIPDSVEFDKIIIFFLLFIVFSYKKTPSKMKYK